jgi:hypothetical protein
MTTIIEDKPAIANTRCDSERKREICSELCNRTYWLNAYTTSPVLLRELPVLSWLINATLEGRLKEVCVKLIINRLHGADAFLTGKSFIWPRNSLLCGEPKES